MTLLPEVRRQLREAAERQAGNRRQALAQLGPMRDRRARPAGASALVSRFRR